MSAPPACLAARILFVGQPPAPGPSQAFFDTVRLLGATWVFLETEAGTSKRIKQICFSIVSDLLYSGCLALHEWYRRRKAAGLDYYFNAAGKESNAKPLTYVVLLCCNKFSVDPRHCTVSLD